MTRPQNANNVHRCQPCDTDWPRAEDYETCPKCLAPTFETYGRPIEDAKKYLAFRDYYQERADAEFAPLADA